MSIDGDVALAFPATLPDATPGGHIRGIGRRCTLLVDRWPLREAGNPSGMRPADLDATGQPVEPRTVNRSIPFQIRRRPSARSRTAAASDRPLLNLLQQAHRGGRPYGADRRRRQRTAGRYRRRASPPRKPGPMTTRPRAAAAP